MIRDLLRSVTPPIFPDTARRLGILPTPGLNCEGAFESFEDAAEAARSSYHDDEAITATVVAKTRVLRAMAESRPIPGTLGLFGRIAETLGLVLVRSPQTIAVLDFGGALGTAYFVADALARERIRSWAVVEIPESAAWQENSTLRPCATLRV